MRASRSSARSSPSEQSSAYSLASSTRMSTSSTGCVAPAAPGAKLSSSATKATGWPAASSWTAISWATTPPSDQPARAYGPSGWMARIAAMYCAAMSRMLVAASSQERPRACSPDETVHSQSLRQRLVDERVATRRMHAEERPPSPRGAECESGGLDRRMLLAQQPGKAGDRARTVDGGDWQPPSKPAVDLRGRAPARAASARPARRSRR